MINAVLEAQATLSVVFIIGMLIGFTFGFLASKAQGKIK